MASIPLAEGGLDRAAHRRLDKDWLEAAFRNPDVLVLVMQDGKPLMDESGHRLLWLGGQAGALAKDATRIFLGEDKNGSTYVCARYAGDVSAWVLANCRSW